MDNHHYWAALIQIAEATHYAAPFVSNLQLNFNKNLYLKMFFCTYGWPVYDSVLKVEASIRSCGVSRGGRCGIYGGKCTEWVVSI